VVDDRDLVVQRIRIGLVEEKALLDHGLIVLVKRHTRALIGARALKATGFDLQHVVAAVVVDIDPFADGMPRKVGSISLGQSLPSVRIRRGVEWANSR
jgi:hypothetical protein